MPGPKRAALKTILSTLAKIIPHFTDENDGEALNSLRKPRAFSLR